MRFCLQFNQEVYFLWADAKVGVMPSADYHHQLAYPGEFGLETWVSRGNDKYLFYPCNRRLSSLTVKINYLKKNKDLLERQINSHEIQLTYLECVFFTIFPSLSRLSPVTVVWYSAKTFYLSDRWTCSHVLYFVWLNIGSSSILNSSSRIAATDHNRKRKHLSIPLKTPSRQQLSSFISSQHLWLNVMKFENKAIMSINV